MSSEMKILEQSKKAVLMRVPALRFPEFRDSANWNKKELNKLLTVGSGKDYKHLSTGDIPVYGSGGYMLSVNDYLYDGESVCIGRKGTIDKPIFLTGKFWTVDTLFYTHSFIKCSPKFIFYQFQKINWKNHNEAGGIPSLSKTTIGKIEIWVPSFSEQQKIADCLSSLDSVITLQTQKIDALQQYKKGLMQKLFPAEGEITPSFRFPEFKKMGDWTSTTLGSLCSNISSGRDKLDIIGKYNLYGSTGIIGKADNYSYNGDFILVARVGANAGTLTRTNGKFGITDNTLIISLHDLQYTNFIYYTLEKLALNKLAFGSGQPLITGSQLKKLIICVPSAIEQQKIADCLSSLDKLIVTETQKLATLKTHKTGLMQQLFPAMDEVNA
jgi:type I restriction enzyme S subunit